MAVHGEQLLDRALELSRHAGEAIGALPLLRLLGPELDGRPGVAGRDETMILIDVSGLGMTGYQAADWLYEQRRVGAEHHDLQHLMFIVTVADDDRTLERLISAMHDLVAAAPDLAADGAPPSLPPVSQPVGDYLMAPREAFLGTTRSLTPPARSRPSRSALPARCAPARPASTHSRRLHRVPAQGP
jgi:hypothetical protein